MKIAMLLVTLLTVPITALADLCPHYPMTDLRSMPMNKLQDLEAALYSNGCFIESDRVNQVLHVRLEKVKKHGKVKSQSNDAAETTYFKSLDSESEKSDPCMALKDSDAKSSCIQYKYSQTDCTQISQTSAFQGASGINDCLKSNSEKLVATAARLKACVRKFPEQASDPNQWRMKMDCLSKVVSAAGVK